MCWTFGSKGTMLYKVHENYVHNLNAYEFPKACSESKAAWK